PEQRRPHGHVGYSSVAFRSYRCCCLYPCLVQDVCSFNGSADNDFRCDNHFLRRHASAISRYNGVYYRPRVSHDSRYNGACCRPVIPRWCTYARAPLGDSCYSGAYGRAGVRHGSRFNGADCRPGV
ncbi:unnamed protein product, partial [Ectocarpus sp. 12 AP-2014]